MSIELANLLYPDIKETREELLQKRWTAAPAFRMAPSPTGFVHIGSVGIALVNFMLARTMGGKSYLRIEDTDQKREVDGAADNLIKTFAKFGITFDNEPFLQSERLHYYHVFAKDLVARGEAYPCFCTEDHLAKIREKQTAKKVRTGYYGEYARCKKMPLADIRKKIEKGEKWVLRMDFDEAYADRRVVWKDLVKGDMSLPYEINNTVIVKSNGFPPYNLAHTVDDILMGITHVVRGEEWLASAAEHIQIYEALLLPHPEYVHMPVICVEENGAKRKLSKRKDKEALAQNFLDEGYPVEAIIEYMLTIYNTDYELWRTANPTAPWQEFKFRFEKIGSNSPLFDWNKLNNISSNIIANMTSKQVNKEVTDFFARTGADITEDDLIKIYTVLAVDRGTARPRKDICKYSEILTVFDYLFKPVTMTPLLEKYAELVRSAYDRDQWFAMAKERAAEFGFANVRDFTQAVRVALTGKQFTTDLYTISKIMLV